jgi:anti-anti-sigma factor
MDLNLGYYQVTEDITVIDISGELDVYTSPRLRDLIVRLIKEGSRRFVLAFDGSVLWDSTGIGALVGALKRTRARRRGDETTISIVTADESRVMRSLRMIGFTKIFPIYNNLNAAILSLYREPFAGAMSSVDSDGSELGEWPWFSARLFLPDEGAMADAESSFVDLIKSSGLKIVYVSTDEDRSLREFVLRVGDSSSKLVREEVETVIYELFERNPDSVSNQSNEGRGRVLAALKSVLESITEFVVQFDSSVLVKSDDSMTSYQLPRLQFLRYEADPTLFRDPAAARLKLREMQGLEFEKSSNDKRLLLFAGTSWYGDTAVEKAESLGIVIKRSSLYSRPGDWHVFRAVLGNPALMGAVVKFTPTVYKLISDAGYREGARQALHALSQVRNIVFVHEYLLSDKDPEGQLIDTDSSSSHENATDWKPNRFGIPTRAVRAEVNEIIGEYGLNLVAYKTNAEASVLAARFIDESERNLLFRVYVPSDRLYATEADKLILLFRDWLIGTGKRGIKQDNYRTAAGQVYEFFGTEALRNYELTREFDAFSAFMEQCVNDPGSAAKVLISAGLQIQAAEKMVARYSKEARRLQLDIRQERESRLLSIRHTLEADLLNLEADTPSSSEQINAIIEHFMPDVPESASKNLLSLPPSTQAVPLTLNINQQIINATQSTILQNVQGTVNLGFAAKEFLQVIDRFAGVQAPALEAAVQEFDDPDARPADRLYARQKLKTFFLQVGSKLEDTAFMVLQKYLETKIGGK